LDSHADSCGVNHEAKILETYGQAAEVSEFSDSCQPLQDVPMVKAAIAYDNPNTGETVILIINQAFYFVGDKLTHILLNPNQMRSNNIQVDDIPKHLSTTSLHSIIAAEDNFVILLNLKEIMPCFHARTPSIMETETCQNIVLTSKEECYLYSPHFEDLEREAKNINDQLEIAAVTSHCIEYSDLILEEVKTKRFL
jgi:hypothetical protein